MIDMPQFAAQVDARIYPPRDKHNVIFQTFNDLKKGEAMELINDHDPRKSDRSHVVL